MHIRVIEHLTPSTYQLIPFLLVICLDLSELDSASNSKKPRLSLKVHRVLCLSQSARVRELGSVTIVTTETGRL